MKGCAAFGSAQLLDLSTNLTKSAICTAFWLFLTKTTDTLPVWAVSIHHLRAVSATFFQLTTHFWFLGSFWILATLRANFDRVYAAPKHINSFQHVFYSARRPSSLAIINSNAQLSKLTEAHVCAFSLQIGSKSSATLHTRKIDHFD